MGRDWINKDFRFPIATTINCAHSFNNFDDLKGLLPDELETLIIEPKFLTKDFLEKNLDTVTKFLEMYPNVTVKDSRGIQLGDVVNGIIQENKAKVKKLEANKRRSKILRTRYEIINTGNARTK